MLKRKWSFWALALVGVVMVGAALLPATQTPAHAQDGGEFELPPGVTWDEVNAIASKMYCDVCEGTPLDECESIACRQWREEIARQLAEGRSEDEIIDYFVERYGADVAALPRDKSDLFLVFAVPTVLALIFGVIGGRQVWKMRQRGQHAGQPVRRSAKLGAARPMPDGLDPALLERLNRELEGGEDE